MNDSNSDAASRRARFEETALPLLRRVYNVALRLAHKPEDANDLTQETFLRAFRTFDNFRAGTDSKAWLLTILYSVFINSYWKRKREGLRVPVELAEAGHGHETTASSRNADVDMLRAANPEKPGAEVANALLGLPDPFRAAVLMVDVEQMSYEEAAAALQCPVGTLRSRLFRARKLLFIALRDYARATGYLKNDDGH